MAINTLQRVQLLALLHAVNSPAAHADRASPASHTDMILPGYSFGQHRPADDVLAHLLAFVGGANLARAVHRLHGAYRRINTSSAGAAIMVGLNFPGIARTTAELLGFDSVHENCADATSRFSMPTTASTLRR